MLAEAQRHDVAHHYLLADIEAIPQAAATFDTARSNLAVQWCSDLRGALSELYRVVRLAERWRLVPRRKVRCRNFVRRGEQLMTGSMPTVFARGATGKRAVRLGR